MFYGLNNNNHRQLLNFINKSGNAFDIKNHFQLERKRHSCHLKYQKPENKKRA